MQEDELQQFRKGFCEKAAELGITPSELLKVSTLKQASVFDSIKSILGFGATKIPWYTGLLLLGGGATLGGLTAYGINESRKIADPDDEFFGDEADPIRDAKKIQLIAKYRNAINQAKGF
jgi:hypothetical protein